MTDAHCHVARGESRHFICEPCGGEGFGESDALFFGLHPWLASDAADAVALAESLAARLAANPSAGVGEIGLDRLKSKTIPDAMRRAFAAQLAVAADFARPVVLHGAKCWGEVVKACKPYKGRIPAFLFHGFSRSGGLLPQIAALNGFVSVGPAILNDHAVNYRELAKAIPLDRLLVESDATAENAATAPRVEAVARRLAELRGLPFPVLAETLDANAERFLGR